MLKYTLNSDFNKSCLYNFIFSTGLSSHGNSTFESIFIFFDVLALAISKPDNKKRHEVT